MLMNQEYLYVFSKALYYFICDRYVPPAERAEVPVTVQKGNKNTEEKKIIWVNQPPDHNLQRRGRRPATNILNSDAGAVLGRARDCEREIDCVELFISKEIQELLVAEMNRKIANYNSPMHCNSFTCGFKGVKVIFGEKICVLLEIFGWN